MDRLAYHGGVGFGSVFTAVTMHFYPSIWGWCIAGGVVLFFVTGLVAGIMQAYAKDK